MNTLTSQLSQTIIELKYVAKTMLQKRLPSNKTRIQETSIKSFPVNRAMDTEVKPAYFFTLAPLKNQVQRALGVLRALGVQYFREIILQEKTTIN